MKKRAKLAVLACVAAVAAVALATAAIGAGDPANKAVASGSKIEVFSADGASQNGVELNRVLFKTSKPEDLLLSVSAECEIFTEHTRDGKSTVNEASGSVRMWLEFDGKIIPIEATSAPPQDPSAQPAGDESDKVTFCQRDERFDKMDNNLTCLEPTPPITTSPTGCEFEHWFQRVKSANAFNWVRLNAGSGDHTIVLKADIVTATGATTPGELSNVRAAVGNRTLIVEPTKFSVDAIVAPVGTN